MNINTAGLTLIYLCTVMVAGCFRDTPIKFYLLNAELSAPAKQNQTPALSPEPIIGLGPIHIPEYLNRQQMIVGISEYEYRLDENHRWAERLDQNIGRVLEQSLSTQIPYQIVRHPWPLRQRIDFQASVDILKLHLDNNGYSRMSAHWVIKNREKTFSTKIYECKLPVPKDDFDTLVKLQSECVGKLSHEIADALIRVSTSNFSKNPL